MITPAPGKASLLKARALQSAILNSVGFSSIATDERGVIQFFNPGAQRMLGYADADVVSKLTLADFSDPLEAAERARALSLEFATDISPGFEALVFKASRGLEDKYELTYIRKDGSRLAAAVSVSALHDPKSEIIGYLLIATDNSARKPTVESAQALIKPRASRGAPRCRLLYVEDDPESVGLVEELIARRTDVLLLRAADLDLGLELARAERPEVILLNVDLPGIGAIQFMKRLRADPATEHTPILALSANAGQNAVKTGLEAGFFYYLPKPIAAEPLVEALDHALEFAAREQAEENHMLPARAVRTH